MLFNIIFKQYLNIFIRNFVLCIQIRFVSTEKTTRIASRASCYIIYINDLSNVTDALFLILFANDASVYIEAKMNQR